MNAPHGCQQCRRWVVDEKVHTTMAALGFGRCLEDGMPGMKMSARYLSASYPRQCEDFQPRGQCGDAVQ